MADVDAPTANAVPVAEHTEVRMLLLADRAEVSQGKLYIMGGGFDSYTTPVTPTQIQFGVAFVMAVPWNETNEPHEAILTIEDSDGQAIGQLTVGFTTGRPPDLGRGEEQRVPFAVPQITLPIPAFGVYVVRASVDGRPGPRVTFKVRQGGVSGVAHQQPS